MHCTGAGYKSKDTFHYKQALTPQIHQTKHQTGAFEFWGKSQTESVKLPLRRSFGRPHYLAPAADGPKLPWVRSCFGTVPGGDWRQDACIQLAPKRERPRW